MEAIGKKSGEENILTNIVGTITSYGSEGVAESMIQAIRGAIDAIDTIQLL